MKAIPISEICQHQPHDLYIKFGNGDVGIGVLNNKQTGHCAIEFHDIRHLRKTVGQQLNQNEVEKIDQNLGAWSLYFVFENLESVKVLQGAVNRVIEFFQNSKEGNR